MSVTGRELRAEIARLQAVVDAALAWDAEMFNKQIWHETERDLHDALAPFRALDGEPVVSRSVERRLKIQRGVECPTCGGDEETPAVRRARIDWVLDKFGGSGRKK